MEIGYVPLMRRNPVELLISLDKCKRCPRFDCIGNRQFKRAFGYEYRNIRNLQF